MAIPQEGPGYTPTILRELPPTLAAFKSKLVKCHIGDTTFAYRLANIEIRGILRTVSRLTAEMPMRHACSDTCRKHHWSVETSDAGSVRSTQVSGFTRMPAFFYRRNLIRMMMTIEMIAIQILIGLHLLIAQSEFICPKGATPCTGWATTNDAFGTLPSA